MDECERWNQVQPCQSPQAHVRVRTSRPSLPWCCPSLREAPRVCRAETWPRARHTHSPSASRPKTMPWHGTGLENSMRGSAGRNPRIRENRRSVTAGFLLGPDPCRHARLRAPRPLALGHVFTSGERRRRVTTTLSLS